MSVAGMSAAVATAPQPHHGVFITAPGQVELRRDCLPERWFDGGYEPAASWVEITQPRTAEC